MEFDNTLTAVHKDTLLNYLLTSLLNCLLVDLLACLLPYLILTYLLTYSLTHSVTYLLTRRSTVLLEKLTGSQLVKKFPAFYGTSRFISAFTSSHQLSLSWTSSIQSISPTSHFLKIHLNIILPSTPGSSKRTLSIRFPHQIPVNPSPLPDTRYMSRPSHSSRFYHPNSIGWGVHIIKLLIL